MVIKVQLKSVFIAIALHLIFALLLDFFRDQSEITCNQHWLTSFGASHLVKILVRTQLKTWAYFEQKFLHFLLSLMVNHLLANRRCCINRCSASGRLAA